MPDAPHTFLGAPVTPRVRPAPDAEPLPLDYHLQKLLSLHATGFINLFGPPGSGKSMALAHVATLFHDPRLLLIDDADPATLVGSTHGRLIVFTSPQRAPNAFLAFELLPWTGDDLIEYLLHEHRARCTSVMNRIRALPDLHELAGLPRLLATLLDEFAADETLISIPQAFRKHIAGRLPSAAAYDYVTERCLHNVIAATADGEIPGVPPSLSLLRHRVPAVALAAEKLCAELLLGHTRWLNQTLPHTLLQATAALFAPHAAAQLALEREASARPSLQPMAASLLIACNPAWRPSPENAPPFQQLCRLHASGAQWQGLDLSNVNLAAAHMPGADFSGCTGAHLLADEAHFARASFRGATLNGLHARRAILADADFRNASLDSVNAAWATFARADLSAATGDRVHFACAALTGATLEDATFSKTSFDNADLTGARCARVTLRRCSFRGATVEGADFTRADLAFCTFDRVRLRGAELKQASFHHAALHQCDLEQIELLSPDFEYADLTGSYFTASHMPNANFHGASLRDTGLAHISWENADLRNSDFSGASFHLGSSRSGLVGSTLASEGSRTGFYTDDYHDQHFKAPEQIRKANLRGANFLGAKVHECDFYLVDLRGARYSEDQAHHFRGCGAILDSPPAD